MRAPSFMHRTGQTVRTAVRKPARRGPKPKHLAPSGSQGSFPSASADDGVVDLKRRRDQLNARVAELQWDLGGLVYEMAIRDRIRVDVLVRRAAVLQSADAE